MVKSSALLVVLLFGFILFTSSTEGLNNRRTRDSDTSVLTTERIVEWHNRLYDTINVLGAPGGGASGLRAWALMTLAMFDSVNFASRSPYNPYIDFSGLPSNITVKKVNLIAAAAKSAQIVLNGLIPVSTSAAVRTQLEYGHLAQLNIHIGSLDRDSPRTINGLALGEWVGQQVLLKRSTDGHPPNHCNSFPNAATPACPNYIINSTVWSEYQFNLPYFPGAPNSPGYPEVAPFGIPSYSDSRWFVPAPPVPGSAEWLTNWKELYTFGTTDPSASLKTTETDNTARFHDGNFGSQIGWAIDVLSSADIRLNSVDLLRVLALSSMSSHDSHAAHWFFKYYYRNGRPIVQYRQVPSSIGEGFEYRDLSFTPTLTTSQTPEYPSGHSARTGGATLSFIKAFGDVPPGGSFQTISYSSPSLGFRVFNSFNDFYQEVQNSRMYGGVHWRAALNEGRNLAQKVTDYIWANSLTKKGNSGGSDDDDE